MATFFASQAVDMTTGLADISSDVSLQQLLQIDPSGAHQYWAVSNGHGMSFDMTVPDLVNNVSLLQQIIEGTANLDIGLNSIALHTSSGDENSPLMWQLSGGPLLLDVSLHMNSFQFSALPAGSLSMDVSIPDLYSATISANFANYADPGTYDITLSNEVISPTYGGSFVPYLFRLADSITGSGGSDNLLGYAGNDTMAGGGGNDVMDGGAGNDILNGGAGADQLKGGAGTDQLHGGAANDKLTGGAGADKFFFDTALTSNKDTILDFNHGQGDKIVLDMTTFHKFTAAGALGAHLDVVGAGPAQDGNDWIVYNHGTGELSYDANGSGSGAGVVFAVLGTGTHPATLVAADFQVVL